MNIIKSFLFILITIHVSCESADENKENKNNVTALPTADTSRAEERPFANIQFASKFDTGNRSWFLHVCSVIIASKQMAHNIPKSI